jgi:hypothetical protein
VDEVVNLNLMDGQGGGKESIALFSVQEQNLVCLALPCLGSFRDTLEILDDFLNNDLGVCSEETDQGE